MATKSRTAVGLFFAISFALFAIYFAASALFFSTEPATSVELSGYGTQALLPVLGLFLLTLVGYTLALGVSHTRLALIQAVAMFVYAIAMIICAIYFIVKGVGTFIGLVTLALAFPFGTIAYFVKYDCRQSGSSAAFFGDTCFAGVQLMALAIVVLKLLGLIALLVGSVGFAKVKGLLFVVVIGSGLAVSIFFIYTLLGGVSFVMYPVDAIVTAALGITVFVYGIVVAVMALFALALAIAGQVG